MALMFSNLIFDVSLMFFFSSLVFFHCNLCNSFINFFKISCFTIMTTLYVMFFNSDMSNYIILLNFFLFVLFYEYFFLNFINKIKIFVFVFVFVFFFVEIGA
jgi:hypothetical protein